MDEFIATIKMFGFNFAPRGWALCDGRILSIAQNTALFSLLGTTYGGNGQTTFALPDLRGRIALGQGQGPGLQNRTIGEVAGSETNTLTVPQMPAHNHTATATSNSTSTSTSTMSAESNAGSLQNPSGKMFASGVQIYANEDPAANRTMSPQCVATTTNTTTTTQVTVGNNGSSQPVNNLQPFLCVNYSICLEGIFPSRN
jgi:microcystin-dependent protein